MSEKKQAFAPDLDLPAEIAGRRTAVFGISGSGKSNTATVLVEHLLGAGEQIVLIDPKGEGWGLLSLASGKPSDLPVIVFGEPNGHIETVNETHGPRLADFVVDTGRSVVLSLLGFESDQSERRFVATFLRQLYRRKSRQGRPTRTLVVLDEAHLFVPENARGDGAELSGAVQRIVRQGRSFGIGTLLIDQRPQDVAKRVVTQCDTLICHQLVHNTDRDALRDWVRGYDTDGRGKLFLDSLATLQPGEAWVWSPAWLKVFKRVQVPRRRTFDSGAAPDGSATARTVQRADVDLDALRGQLTEIVEQAKANDPAALKRKVADLEKQLREQKPGGLNPQERDEVHRAGYDAGLLAAAHASAAKLAPVRELLTNTSNRLDGVLEVLTAVPITAFKPKTPAPAAPVAPRPATVKPVPQPVKAGSGVGSAEVGHGGLRRILIALAQRAGLTNRQLGLRAGLSSQSGTFSNYLGRARSNGWVRDEGERRFITDEGLKALGEYTPLPEGPDLLAYWLGELGQSGAARMLRALADAYPGTLSNQQLGEKAGISSESGTFSNYLGRLRGLELVEGRGQIKASAELF